MDTVLLSIRDLHASVNGTPILRGVNLDIGPNQTHAIMGPNGSGKSTLAYVLAGRPGYQVDRGTVLFREQDLLALPPERRACEGLFLGFQHPIELPGVSNVYLLKSAFNAVRRHRGEQELDAIDFLHLVRDRLASVGVSEDFLQRSVNAGFSGGEKKRNEILQMAVLEPKLAILDEVDSGLDVDALKSVADSTRTRADTERSLLLITHYQRLLNHIRPDHVHVMNAGRLVKSGDYRLAIELDQRGYDWLNTPGPEAASGNAA